MDADTGQTKFDPKSCCSGSDCAVSEIVNIAERVSLHTIIQTIL